MINFREIKIDTNKGQKVRQITNTVFNSTHFLESLRAI